MNRKAAKIAITTKVIILGLINIDALVDILSVEF
jgi:hypothetical protein